MPDVTTDVDSLKITKANRLIEVRLLEVSNRLRLRDQKIVMAVIGQLSPDDKDFKNYKISLSELIAITGIDKRDLYREIEDSCTRLMSSVIKIKEPDNPKGFLLVTWFSHARYNPEKGWIEFSISPELKPYLLQVKNQFTTYNMAQIASLNSTYSIRLYELLRQFLPLRGVENGQKIAFRNITISDLREYIGVEKKRYPRFADFRRHVLERSQEELKQLTDIAFDFEPVRAGRKIDSIKFIIKHNQRFESVADDVIDGSVELPDEDLALTGIGSSFAKEMLRANFKGISDDEIFIITHTYRESIVNSALVSFISAENDGKIKSDPKSYFLGILEKKKQETESLRPKSTEERLTDRSWADDLEL